MYHFKQTMQNYISLIENHLSKTIEESAIFPDEVAKAMQYSLLSGGKRIRGILVLEFCRLYGGNVFDALSFAGAIEMIHAYSLIHDDLPCMDNDDMRRGKPSCHIAFGEATALLAGDGLLTLAFESALNCTLPTDRVITAAKVLSKEAGYQGMIAGQMIDLYGEKHPLDAAQIQQMYLLKTAALIRAAGKTGAILAGGTQNQVEAADQYCKNIGLAFQFVDDLLDVSGDQNLLGKPIGSDQEKHKSTFLSLHGIEVTSQLAESCKQTAKEAIGNIEDARFLLDLADMLATRQS